MVLGRNLSLTGCLTIAFLLMGMVGGCTQSRTPLSPREDGFADLYLLGKWNQLDINDQGKLEAGDLAYDVSLTENGNLHILQYEDDDTIGFVYSGFSTRLKSKKYLNVRIIGCPACDEEQLAALALDSCPYQIVQYTTFFPRNLATFAASHNKEASVDNLIEQATALRGRLLFVGIMDDDFISDAILDELIAGDSFCETCVHESACITSHGVALQRFLLERDLDIYGPKLNPWFIRASEP